MKKITGLVLAAFLILAVMQGTMTTAYADTDATVIPKGFIYEINSNGKYQLAEDYEGYIIIKSDVTEVTVTDEVYGETNTNTCIMIENGRSQALELTIKDLDITARDSNAGIDFSRAGDYPHKLLISGTCYVRAVKFSKAGIQVPSGVQLTIDKAAGVENDAGACLAVAGGYGTAGIGGAREEYATAGTININGGTITATGGNGAACIGGGEGGSGGTIAINGGIITTTGNRSGAGIGGGSGGAGGNITITGGKIEAAAGILLGGGAGIGGGSGGAGGIIEISDGEVNAAGNPMAAGIGGGSNASGGSITISGGTVEAKATTYYNPDFGRYSGGAGIGGGSGGASGIIVINGGTVTATGSGYGSGIGSGSRVASEKTPGTITINDGTVTATGFGGGAGIGSGLRSKGDTITVNGGTIIANSKYMEDFGAGGAGIGGGYESEEGTISISGGTVTATSSSMGAGIGGGYNGSGGIITITGDSVVTASAGYSGAGIGGGENGSGGTITISGGTVTASSALCGAGIGGGKNGSGGSITINDSNVTANGGGGGAGIGGGYNGSGGSIRITNSMITAEGYIPYNYVYRGGAGIGGGCNGEGGAISISGGNIEAIGDNRAAGIGGGENGSGGNVIIDNTAIVAAKGGFSWGDQIAENIGMGSGGLDSGTLKDGSGADMAYILFSTREGYYTKLADVKITVEGTESFDGEYTTNNQGLFGRVVYYTESIPFSYTASKAGYAAVKDNGLLSSVNHDISIDMTADNTQSNICTVTPTVMKTGVTAVAAFNNDYGIYGTLYLVRKAGADYSSKAALDGAAVRKLDVLNNTTTEGIDTTGLSEGSYQVYLADSAENVSVPVEITIDNTPPSVLINGEITASNITRNSVVLTWNKAADLSTAEAELEYCIYRSSDNNLDTVADIEANGRAVNSYAEDINVFTASGLQAGSRYYFNIIVRDKAGNKSCYNSVSVITPSKPEKESNNSSGITQNSGQTTMTGIDTTVREITLPVSTIAGAAGKTVEIRTEHAVMTLPSNMLTAEAAGNAVSAVLSVSRVDTTGLPEEVKAKIGNRPAIELSLKLDGKAIAWNNPDAPVTVAIPYAPTAEELANPENITIWYMDGEGNIVSVPSGRYDPETGTVTFTTTHFSYYAVAYVQKTFSDLGKTIWAKKPIEVLAAKGIMSGRTENEFAPEVGITRAEYVAALVRTMGVSAKAEGSFSDVRKGSNYYNEIATAKKLGITNGTGSNSFKPEMTITRQDMLVLTERALRSMNRLNGTGIMSDLEQFTDRTQLADYAVESIAALVKEGLIKGSNGKLNVGADATRAEAAVFLYRIYNKQ